MSGIERTNKNSLPSPLILSCPGCTKELKVVTHYQSNHIACSCRRILRLSTEGLALVECFAEYEIESLIPLGSKGKFGGVLYKVVGFLHCKEVSSQHYWKEYIMFNPMFGYVTLTEFSGHWNLLKPTRNFPRLKGYPHSFEFDSEEFKIFNKYETEVVIGIGEFTTNILNRYKTKVYEFVCPPKILIRELNDDEEVWYQGEYIEAKSIWSAFGLKSIPPQKTGVGATQPLKLADDVPILKSVMFLALFFLLCLQVMNYYLSDNTEVFNNSYNLPIETEVSPIVTPQFTLAGGTSNVEFNLYSNVQNEWFEAQITLINDLTGEEYSFEEGVEYYSGYEGGSSWSEGSHTSSKTLSSIPDGKYHMNIFPYKPYTAGGLYFTLIVKRDVLMWSNFFLFLFLILAYPLVQWTRVSSYESRRWMNSDFTPN